MKTVYRTIASAAFVICLAFNTTACAQNFVSNSGFESQKNGLPVGWRVQHKGSCKLLNEATKQGDRCLELSSDVDKGFVTVWAYQTLSIDSTKTKSVRFSGCINIPSTKEANAYGYLELSFVPNADSGRVAFQSFKSENVSGKSSGWQDVSMEIPVPMDAGSVMVKCVIRGQGQALFDKIELTSLADENLEPLRLVEVESRLIVHQKSVEKELPWISVSVPLLLNKQIPLAVRVESDPAHVVKEIAFHRVRDNYPLKVTFNQLEAGTMVRLRVKTLVCMGNRSTSSGKGIFLPTDEVLKGQSELQTFLRPAPGVEVDNELIVQAAEKLDRTDFASLIGDLNKYLKQNLKYTTDKTQGAVDCIESGKAVCTGYANVAAALLRRNKIPTRILACLVPNGKLQEHYIVEAWTEELGWSRIESTSAMYPWDDIENVILRIVHPDAKRTDYFAPLYQETGGGIVGGRNGSVFDLSRESNWSCQFTKHLADFGVEPAFATKLCTNAKNRITRLMKHPATGASANLFANSGRSAKLKNSDKFVELVRSWTSNNDPTFESSNVDHK